MKKWNFEPLHKSDLRPFVLTRQHKPETFAIWKRALEAWYQASHFEALPLKSAQEYVRKVVERELMALIEADFGDKSPIFDDENEPENTSIISLLSNEISDRSPLVSQRYSFFQQQMSKTQTFSSYIASLRTLGNFCDLPGLDPNQIIIFYALTTLKGDDYNDLRDELLCLPPEDLTLDRALRRTKTYESARFAFI